VKQLIDGAIQLWHGDVLSLPQTTRADVFVTDPPYARAGAVHTGRTSAGGTQSDAAGADQFWLFWFNEVCKRLTVATKPTGCGFVFCDYRTIHLVERAFSNHGSGWLVTQCLVWHRKAMGLGSPFRASHELIAFCRGPAFEWGGRRDLVNVLEHRWVYGEHEHHPAEKPVGLLRFLIEETTKPGDIVLDPFCGSGSTLVAARASGRRAVGVEIEEVHCNTARRRLDQGDLFGTEAA
jgi:adenine-specific DNA-methyltransferase